MRMRSLGLTVAAVALLGAAAYAAEEVKGPVHITMRGVEYPGRYAPDDETTSRNAAIADAAHEATREVKRVMISRHSSDDEDEGCAAAEARAEADEAIREAMREVERNKREIAREAREAARDAAREAQSAAREVARHQREIARAAREAAKEAMREVKRHKAEIQRAIDEAEREVSNHKEEIVKIVSDAIKTVKVIRLEDLPDEVKIRIEHAVKLAGNVDGVVRVAMLQAGKALEQAEDGMDDVQDKLERLDEGDFSDVVIVKDGVRKCGDVSKHPGCAPLSDDERDEIREKTREALANAAEGLRTAREGIAEAERAMRGDDD